MARVVPPGGWVAVTDEIEHPYTWMRTEHADIWLGFTADQAEGFVGSPRLARYLYATLGSQRNVKSTTSGRSRHIGIFAAWGQVQA